MRLLTKMNHFQTLHSSVCYFYQYYYPRLAMKTLNHLGSYYCSFHPYQSNWMKTHQLGEELDFGYQQILHQPLANQKQLEGMHLTGLGQYSVYLMESQMRIDFVRIATMMKDQVGYKICGNFRIAYKNGKLYIIHFFQFLEIIRQSLPAKYLIENRRNRISKGICSLCSCRYSRWSAGFWI